MDYFVNQKRALQVLRLMARDYSVETIAREVGSPVTEIRKRVRDPRHSLTI